jgi:hypothetical protein
VTKPNKYDISLADLYHVGHKKRRNPQIPINKKKATCEGEKTRFFLIIMIEIINMINRTKLLI